jgi:pimeloyl-ACP methyl ester carboxylesterase
VTAKARAHGWRPRLRRALFCAALLAAALGCRRRESASSGEGRHVVLLVPGYAGGRMMMAPGARALRRAVGAETHVFSYSDWGLRRPIPEYSRQLEDYIQGLRLGPRDRLDLVAFSMGGLVCRHYLEVRGGPADRLVTVCTPHAGTTKGSGFVRASDSLRDLQPGSEFLAVLNSLPRRRDVQYHSVFLSRDGTVRPPGSARLPGAANRELPGRLHSLAPFSPRVRRAVLKAMTARPGNSTP